MSRSHSGFGRTPPPSHGPRPKWCAPPSHLLPSQLPKNPTPPAKTGKAGRAGTRRSAKAVCPHRPAPSQKTHLPPAELRLHGQRTPPGSARYRRRGRPRRPEGRCERRCDHRPWKQARSSEREKGVAQRQKKIFWGGTERERLGRLIRSPESSRFLLCLFPCGRSPSLSALTSIKLKLCALPWGPPLTAYSRSSFLRLRRSLISDTADRRSSLLIGTPDL